MPYWRQIDSNGAFVKGEGINQDTPPGPNYVQANYRSEWLGGDSLFNMPESVEVKVAKEAARKMSLNDGERNREIQVKTENVLRQFADGRVLPPQPDEKPDPLQDPIKQGPNTIRAYKTADGSEVWRLLEGTTWTAPAVAAQARSFEQEKILRGIPTSSSSFGVSELGPVAAQLRREEAEATIAAAKIKAAADLRVNNAAILKGEEETAIAKRNEAFAIDKDGYARSVDNVKLQREAQSELFKQQNEVARLTAEQVGLVARRDESQASLDQAVNLANMSAEQRGQEFNVTQEFNVQRANEEAARARQQQLQTLGTDIGKLGADSGDRGQYAATILANSGWGQADRALAGTNMNTTASLSPLESLLRQRETVQNISDKPYTYKATTIPTAARTQVAPVDFSRVTIPTPQPLAAFTPAPAFDPKSVTDTTSPAVAPAGYNPLAGGPNNVATKEQTAAIAADQSGTNPFAGFARIAMNQGQTLGQFNAYGTKGTKEREFITGDPQRNGKPNPELVRVNNPGPDTRVEVIPLQGNGDMNMTSMYADGTDTGLMTADGRKRGPLEVLQYLMTKGVDPQKALDMVNALGFDPATGDWKPENKAPEPEPIPTGPQNLFTEKATEGNVRAGIPASRGIVESVEDIIKENPKTSVAVGAGTGALLGAAAKALLGKRLGKATKAVAKPVAKAAAGAAAAAPNVGGRTFADLSEDEISDLLTGQYAYGTPDAGVMPAGGDVQTIINALRSNPQALDAFMTMIGATAAPAAGGAGAGMPSFPA